MTAPAGETAAAPDTALSVSASESAIYGGKLESGSRVEGGYALRVRLPLRVEP